MKKLRKKKTRTSHTCFCFSKKSKKCDVYHYFSPNAYPILSLFILNTRCMHKRIQGMGSCETPEVCQRIYTVYKKEIYRPLFYRFKFPQNPGRLNPRVFIPDNRIYLVFNELCYAKPIYTYFRSYVYVYWRNKII